MIKAVLTITLDLEEVKEISSIKNPWIRELYNDLGCWCFFKDKNEKFLIKLNGRIISTVDKIEEIMSFEF